MQKQCYVEICFEPSRRNGLCNTHSSRQRKHGDPLAHIPITPKIFYDPFCSVIDCERLHDQLGYCSAHVQRVRKYGDPLAHIPIQEIFIGSDCQVEDCIYPATHNFLCKPHYERKVQYGDPTAGPPIRRQSAKRPKVPMGCKWCSRCGETKFLVDENFGYSKKSPDGRAHWCKRCYTDARLIRAYNITLVQYELMLAAQGGGCATCRIQLDPYIRVSRLSVDHDHNHCRGPRSCGRCVRGLLCSSCNHTLGNARDDVVLLGNMIEYLNHHKERMEIEDARGEFSYQDSD